MNENVLFHLQIPRTVKAKYAILPGDPARVSKIASYLEDADYLVSNREYTTYFGTLCGENVLVTSTGIGGPSTAIALEELHMLGVDTIIRVGTCGGMQETVKSGDLIIATSAVRAEGTSKEYAPIELPATADFEVTSALVKAATKLDEHYHTGIIHSKDSFYGQHNPASMAVSYELENKWNAFIKCGVLASEMETAALFTVSALRNIRAGSILHAIWNQERRKSGDNSENINTENAVLTTIEALKIIIAEDKMIN